MKISVLIRNKNQFNNLTLLFKALDRFKNEIFEIVFIDNNSTDLSVNLAKQYHAKVFNIEKFTYGGALNYGVSKCAGDIVVALSAHTIPVGSAFFKDIKEAFLANHKLAGVRLLNQYTLTTAVDFYTHHKNDNILDRGMSCSGGAFARAIALKYKFNELIPYSEDKLWSLTIEEMGFEIGIVPSFYYYNKSIAAQKSDKKYMNELIGNNILNDTRWNYPIILRRFFGRVLFDLKGFVINEIANLKLLLLDIKVKNEVKKLKSKIR